MPDSNVCLPDHGENIENFWDKVDWREDNRWTVYVHTSPSGKHYVGITSRKPKERWGKTGNGYKKNNYFYRAITKYGWDNFQHEIIAEHLTKDEAYQMEILLIKKLRSNNQKYGYNFLSGGQCMSDEDKEKISQTHKGQNKGKNNHKSVPIICLNDLTIFDSIADANEWLGYNRKYRFLTTVLHSNNEIKIMGTHPITGERCAWDFYYPDKTYEIIKNPQIPPHTNSRMVICIETKQVFSNVIGAANHFNLSRQLIGQCCTGKLEKCGMSIYQDGYHFKYYIDYLKENNMTDQEARDSLLFIL